MNCSIIYLTSRKIPLWQYFCDSLVRQCEGGLPNEVIFIDAVLWEPGSDTRRQELADVVCGRFKYRHEPPKPNVFNGPTRLTTNECFFPANARNTGVCYARSDYLVFCDDLSVFRPDYIKNLRHAVKHHYIVAGSYQKVRELVVEDGEVKSYKLDVNGDGTNLGLDCRWGGGSDAGVVPLRHPADLFGCSFGLPLAAYLQCNGQDEITGGMGAEDGAFGSCLMNNGWKKKMWYNRNMMTWESTELHHQGHSLKRIDKGEHPNNMTHSFVHGSCVGPAGRKLPGIFNPSYRRALGNDFDLAELRQRILNGGQFPAPTEPKTLWWDNSPLSEL